MRKFNLEVGQSREEYVYSNIITLDKGQKMWLDNPSHHPEDSGL